MCVIGRAEKRALLGEDEKIPGMAIVEEQRQSTCIIILSERLLIPLRAGLLSFYHNKMQSVLNQVPQGCESLRRK